MTASEIAPFPQAMAEKNPPGPEFSQKVLTWTLSMLNTGPGTAGFRFSAASVDPSVISTALALLIFEQYNALPVDGQENWQAALLATQDEHSGLFIDPLLDPADLRAGGPGLEYIHQQTTYFALQALDALQGRPVYPLRFIQPYLERVSMAAWLDGLEWGKPWSVSNRVMFLASAVIIQGLNDPSIGHKVWISDLLDWLDTHQDPLSGFWGDRPGVPAGHAMAATYHFLPYYLWMERDFHYPEQMIDSTLLLQGEDGLFHSSQGGDACLDVDALDILLKCRLLTDHRSGEIEQAVERIYWGLVRNQENAGGFCRARLRPLPGKSRKRQLAEKFGLDKLLNRPYQPWSETWKFSGWDRMPYEIHHGDLWSTWFRSFGLGLISRTYPHKYPAPVDWKFRRLPALGWHGPNGSAGELEA